MADHEFVAYIDESGDDGLGNFREHGGTGGASHWLVLGCCIVRRTTDQDLISYRDMLAQIQQTKKRDIHFAKLKHAQKTIVAERLVKLPVKLINVLSCKQHIPDPSIYAEKGHLYWYLCRYLIERISWCCWANRKTQKPRVTLVFSTRGGMKYQDFRDYLGRLRALGDETTIDWRTVSNDEDYIRSEAHERLAGLQLADVTARAFAEAVEPNVFGTYEPSYALKLKPRVYNHKGNFASYGVKVLAMDGLLEARQREFLANYPKN
jgi:hypothetical protein